MILLFVSLLAPLEFVLNNIKQLIWCLQQFINLMLSALFMKAKISSKSKLKEHLLKGDTANFQNKYKKLIY